MNPEEISARIKSKKNTDWSGLYFVNIGGREHRSWEDCVKYGRITSTTVMVNGFRGLNNTMLLSNEFKQSNVKENQDNP
ncbi:hypothetical protein [Priestia megaterium]|uniref:hypothetical protein n=1 Tax=Priestia megaterium TaxID=1404 RepID=UPI00234E858F|nr:hypothetical protein [Priestia megaterium]MDC7783926.1 hypothetical protein [Priestia megaterium]